MRPVVCVALLSLAGCGSQPGEPRPQPANPVVHKQSPKEPARATQWPHMQPPFLTRTYQGMNAEQWAQQLNSPDLGTGREAMFAMAHLGEEADYFVVKALRSHVAIVREHAVQALEVDRLKHMKDVLGSELVKLLGERSMYARHSAITNLSKLGYTEAIPKIEAVIAQERDDSIKKGMQYSLDKLREQKK